MEVAVGIGRAVRRDEQVCPVKIRRVDRRKLDLNRPLAKLGGDDARRGGFRTRTAVHVELTDAAARTAARVLRLLFLFARFHVPGDGGFVIGRGLALLEGNRPGWAGGQAVAQPVAVIVADELGLAVDHRDGAFVAGVCARAAAVAQVFVDANNLTNHQNHSKLLDCRDSV